MWFCIHRVSSGFTCQRGKLISIKLFRIINVFENQFPMKPYFCSLMINISSQLLPDIVIYHDFFVSPIKLLGKCIFRRLIRSVPC